MNKLALLKSALASRKKNKMADNETVAEDKSETSAQETAEDKGNPMVSDVVKTTPKVGSSTGLPKGQPQPSAKGKGGNLSENANSLPKTSASGGKKIPAKKVEYGKGDKSKVAGAVFWQKAKTR